MEVKYVVTLTAAEFAQLHTLVRAGTAAASTLTHARILLKADQAEGGPAWGDARIAEALEVGLSAVHRVRQGVVEEGLEGALHRRRAIRRQHRKLDAGQFAPLVSLVCGPAPDGR